MPKLETSDRKLSILMVAACPFPANYGSPASIREMSDTLGQMGHDVHILTYPFGDDLPIGKATMHRIADLGWSKTVSVGPTLQKPILDLMMVFEACRIIWKHKCDVIHAHNYEGALVGIIAKLVTWRPLLYNAVNTMSDELPGYNFIKPAFLARWLAWALDVSVPQIPDEITTVSPELEEELVNWGISRDKITVVPAGVVPEMFEQEVHPERFRGALNIGPENKVVLYTGTLDPFQRIDYLLEAFALLVPKAPNALLAMVCPFTKASHRAEADELAAKLGITDKIRWVESHPFEDLFDYLALADVAVVSRPHCPGHPVKLLNYMCAGLPIVVAAGAAKGIEHLQNGYVCKDHDVADMAQGMLTLIEDPALGRKLGQAAKQTIREKYDWRILCAQIEDLYGRMLKPAKAPASAPAPDLAATESSRSDLA